MRTGLPRRAAKHEEAHPFESSHSLCCTATDSLPHQTLSRVAAISPCTVAALLYCMSICNAVRHGIFNSFLTLISFSDVTSSKILKEVM